METEKIKLYISMNKEEYSLLLASDATVKELITSMLEDEEEEQSLSLEDIESYTLHKGGQILSVDLDASISDFGVKDGDQLILSKKINVNTSLTHREDEQLKDDILIPYLKKSLGWMKFIAVSVVVTSIVGGLFILSMMIINADDIQFTLLGFFSYLLIFGLIGLACYIGITLLKAANNYTQFIGWRMAALEEALKFETQYWKAMGILLIVYLILGAFSIQLGSSLY